MNSTTSFPPLDVLCPYPQDPILTAFAGFNSWQWRDLRATRCQSNRTTLNSQSSARGDIRPAPLGYIPSKHCCDIQFHRLHHFTSRRRVQAAQRCQVLDFIPSQSAWTMSRTPHSLSQTRHHGSYQCIGGTGGVRAYGCRSGC